MADPLDRIESRLNSHEARLGSIEAWQSAQATNLAVRAERDKHLDKRFDRIEESVNEVKGYLLKIVWVIVLGIVGSLVTFIVSGGLTNVP